MISTTRKVQLLKLAQRLATAWSQSGLIDGPAREELPQDRSEAYFVQDEMARAIGETVSGWKVGATSVRMRELDGHEDVIPGRIFQSVTWAGSRHRLPAERFPAARVETEFAFRLGADLPLRVQPWQSAEIVPWLTMHPAVEIIGNRHVVANQPASVKSLMTVADNGGGIGFVFGNPVQEWQDTDFQQHVIHLTVDNGEPAENFLGEMRCQPAQAVADLANHLAQRGIALATGDFVSTGAATVPQAIDKGARVTADFAALGRINLEFV